MKAKAWLFGLAGVGVILLFLIFKSSHEKVLETSKNIANSPAGIDESREDSRAFDRMQERLTAGIEEQQMINALEAEYQKELAEEARRKAEEEAKRKAEEEAYWESRQEWIANFPFKPTPHPTITFDPEVMNLDVDERGFPIETEEYKVMWRLIDRHVSAKTMYEDHEREMYSPEFERMHHILSEYLEKDSTTWGDVFTHLIWYHDANSQDPEERASPQKTFAQEAEFLLGSFMSVLTIKDGIQNAHERLLPREEAMVLRDRLIAELPAEVMLQHRPIIPHYKYQKMLKAGDALLIR